MIAKKQNKKLYQHTKQADWNKFIQHKSKTQRAVLNTSLETGNNTPFWNCIKSKRTDNIGVSGIKSGGIRHRDSKAKAYILNTWC